MISILYVLLSSVHGNTGVRSVLRSVRKSLVYNRSSDVRVWKFQCRCLLFVNTSCTSANIIVCTLESVLKSTYRHFNTEDSTQLSAEVSAWLSFLAFCKFSLPLFV